MKMLRRKPSCSGLPQFNLQECTTSDTLDAQNHAESERIITSLGLVHFAKKVNPINSIIFVLFGKYCPIVDQLGSKDSSRDFQLNCVISYFFTYI